MGGEIGERLPRPISDEDQRRGITEVVGAYRGLEADLAVVDDLSRLHKCPDDASFPPVLAIVARGLPVITSASWDLAQGDPGRVPKESILRHRPLAMETKFIFEHNEHFAARSGILLNVLKSLSEKPENTWKVVKQTAQDEQSLLDLARGTGPPTGERAKAKGYSVVSITKVDSLRSWVQQNRRIYNVSGAKAWSLTQTGLA